jgi:arsenate reductase
VALYPRESERMVNAFKTISRSLRECGKHLPGPAGRTKEAGMTTIYGIPNCDTMKRARLWLEAHGVAAVFHDYRKAGLDADTLRGWVDEAGWEVVLNRAGTTFRKLPEADKAGLDAERAIQLMLAQPAMIKRPVLVHDGNLEIGFKPERYEAIFRSA